MGINTNDLSHGLLVARLLPMDMMGCLSVAFARFFPLQDVMSTYFLLSRKGPKSTEHPSVEFHSSTAIAAESSDPLIAGAVSV